MTAQRRSGYEIILCSTSNLETSSFDTFAHALARLLRAQDDTLLDPKHECLNEIIHCTSIRPDLLSVLLKKGDVLFVDGSCSKPYNSKFLCGYSVCALPNICIESFALPFSSAQAAELFALTHACALSAGKDVTIYTDSRYAFGVAHDFGLIWQSRGFRSTEGKPISHSSLVQDLIDVCYLPSTLAIIKTRGHSSENNEEARGNSLADRLAKEARQSTFWQSQSCCVASDGLWYSPDGRLCLPTHCLLFLMRSFHGVTHCARRGVKEDMSNSFCIANMHKTFDVFLDRFVQKKKSY